jgi:hypothetical protein
VENHSDAGDADAAAVAIMMKIRAALFIKKSFHFFLFFFSNCRPTQGALLVC